MTEYTPPLRDMNFTLNEIADLKGVLELPRFSEFSADDMPPILDESAKYASQILAPLNHVGDQQGAVCQNNSVEETPGFAQAYRQFCEGGWQALSGNPTYGGMGLPDAIGTCAMEQWAAANTSFALCPMLSQGAINALDSHASDALKEAYLPKMIAGEWTGTMNLTEPQAGSDLAAVRAKAKPVDDYHLISGTKIFITWGDHQMADNVIHLVLARTPEAPAGVKGISLFVVPKYLLNADGSPGERNDVYPVSVEHKLGIHASPTCVMAFGENGGAKGYLVGEENHGLAYMFTMMNHARLTVGVQGVGLSDRAYQLAVSYARERTQGPTVSSGEPTIIGHPDIRRMLMTMRALTEASRALCYLTAASFDKGHGASGQYAEQHTARGELLTPLAKGWSTEIAQEVTSLGVQVHGGMGFIEETGAAQLYRDTRITTIYEGTTGIQANDLVGRKFIRDNGKELFKLLDEIRATCTEMTAIAELQAMAASLTNAVTTLDDTCRWILANYQGDKALPGSVSYHLLMGTGTVVGAWLMAKAALVACKKMDEDPSFYGAKLTVAKFYSQHILPRAQGYADSVKAGSETIMGLAGDQF